MKNEVASQTVFGARSPRGAGIRWCKVGVANKTPPFRPQQVSGGQQPKTGRHELNRTRYAFPQRPCAGTTASRSAVGGPSSLVPRGLVTHRGERRAEAGGHGESSINLYRACFARSPLAPAKPPREMPPVVRPHRAELADTAEEEAQLNMAGAKIEPTVPPGARGGTSGVHARLRPPCACHQVRARRPVERQIFKVCSGSDPTRKSDSEPCSLVRGAHRR